MNRELWTARFRESLELGGYSQRTVESYTREAGLFLDFLEDTGVKSLGQVTRETVEGYRLELFTRKKPDGRPLSVQTQSCKLGAVLSFLRYLFRARFLLVDPGATVTRPRVPDTLPRVLLTEHEVVRLLEAPDTGTPLGLRDRAILEVLYSSALRNSELCALELDCVDRSRGLVQVHRGKGGKSRVVPLGEEAAAWVGEYLERSRPWLVRAPTRMLFLSWRGRRLDREALAVLVRKAARQAGFGERRVTPHVLRHCCATHMLARRAGLRHLQELLGHASADSTRRYTRLEITDLRATHRRCHPRESW